MRHRRGRVVEVDDLDDFDRRLAAGRARPQRLAAAARWTCASAATGCGRAASRARCSSAAGSPTGDEAERRGPRRRGLPDAPRRPARPLPRRASTPPPSSTATPATADSLDARGYAWAESGLDRDGLLAATLHDHAIDEALAAWVAGRSVVGVMGGHGVERGERRLRRRRTARAAARRHATPWRPAAAPARWRRPTSAPGWRARPTTRSRRVLAAVARVPDYRGRIGAWAGAGLDALATVGRDHRHPRHPDVALRARAAQRVRLRHRQVRPQRGARGGAAGDLRRRHRVPARRRRHRAGGLPGRLRELLRRPGVGRPDGAGRPRPLDRGRCRCGRCCSRLADGRAMAGHVHLVDTVEEAAAVIG